MINAIVSSGSRITQENANGDSMVIEEPLFKSAEDALRFAFNFSHQQYDRPLVNRLGDKRAGDGKGLSGMDGAAQAGMIRSRLSSLSNLYRAALIAQYAPKSFSCSCGRPCCAKMTINFEWREAISALATYSCDLVRGGEGKLRLRRDIVFRLYGSGQTFESIASERGVTERTVSAHSREVAVWLRGTKSKADPDRAKIGLETIANREAHEALSSAGLIGVELD